MRHDCLGNPVTTDADATLAAIDDFVEGFLAYETRAERILGAADRAPGCCLANAYAGILWMLLEAPEAPQRAAKYLSRAQNAAHGATRRERMNVELLRAWTDEDLPAALNLCEQIGTEFPRDLAAVKLNQYLEFNRGDAPAMLRAVLRVEAANASVAYVHGMAAFAYEQCHLLDQAAQRAERALRLKGKEPWAQHALAHVHLTRGEIRAGARFMESVAATWTGLNSFMYTHNWWHLALFYLSEGRNADVLGIYDDHCWGIVKSYSQDQIGAVSLLARLELAGVDVGNRWGDLGAHLSVRARDTVQPFLSLQYLYGLARAQRPEADELLQAIRERALAAPPFARATWQQAVLPAAAGLLAHARGDWARARRALEEALPRIVAAGGSHAQRDVFQLILLDARERSGDWLMAQQELERRRNLEPDSVPLNAQLARLYAKLGLTGEAERARERLKEGAHGS